MKHPNTPTKNQILDDLAGTYYKHFGETEAWYASDYDDEKSNASRLVMVKALYERCYPNEALPALLNDNPVLPDEHHELAKVIWKNLDNHYKAKEAK